MNEIEKWLIGSKSYDEGVKLYLKYGKNLSMKKNLSQMESIERKKTLEYELAKLKNIAEEIQDTSGQQQEQHIKTIDEWLESEKDFKTGVLLFFRFGNEIKKKEFFSFYLDKKVVGAFAEDLLLHELIKLNEKLKLRERSFKMSPKIRKPTFTHSTRRIKDDIYIPTGRRKSDGWVLM